MKFNVVITFFIVICAIRHHRAARILSVVWYRAESHFPMFEILLKALAARGHDVTVVSHFPQRNPVDNYTDISVLGAMPSFNNTINISSTGPVNTLLFPLKMFEVSTETCDLFFKHRNVEALLKSEDKFDLIISEIFGCDCALGFIHKFKTPHIALITSVLFPWSNDRTANPDNPAYIPNYFTEYTDRMSFSERLINALYTEILKWWYYYYSELPTYGIAAKYFGDDLPSLSAMARDVSMILVNSHYSISQPRPMVPAVVEVGGLHIQSPNNLPQDIQTFLDEAPEGAIYFSLGTMFRSDTFPPDILQAFIDAFTDLPFRVLWRCNPENMPALPENILVRTWLPQRDILAHPKVRLYITHGGLMGVQEAVYCGVPMVGIPFVSDQNLNMQNLASKGVAVVLDYKSITRERLLTTLRRVLYDTSFQKNMKQLSVAFRDRPQSPLETAIFWTEYVIRHRGAPHLRTAALDLTWYQYLLLDVIAVITITVILTVTLLCLSITKIRRYCSKSKLSLHTHTSSKKLKKS